MDLSFAMQALAVLHILEHHKNMSNEVHNLSDEVSAKVARLKLQALGINIDTLTDEQRIYLGQA